MPWQRGRNVQWSLDVRVTPAYKTTDTNEEQSAYIMISSQVTNRILVQGELSYAMVRAAARQIVLDELERMGVE